MTTQKDIVRNNKGRFVAGTGSPNPGGKVSTAGLIEHFRKQYGDNLEALGDKLKVMLDDGRTSIANKIKIIEIIYNRTYGSPKQSIDATVTTPEPILFVPVPDEEG